VDNTGCDTNPTTGILQLANQTINGVQVNGSIQTSSISAIQNILDTSSLSLINVSGANRAITFTVSDTNFIGPVSTFSTAGSGTWENAVGSSINLGWFNDPTNVQGADFAGDTPGNSIDTFADSAVTATDAFSHTNAGAVSDPALFSMTLNASGTLIGRTVGCNTTTGLGCPSLINRGQTEIKERIATPEPASLALLGSALAGLGLFYRRRKHSA